jgi:hypothetical protein
MLLIEETPHLTVAQAAQKRSMSMKNTQTEKAYKNDLVKKWHKTRLNAQVEELEKLVEVCEANRDIFEHLVDRLSKRARNFRMCVEDIFYHAKDLERVARFFDTKVMREGFSLRVCYNEKRDWKGSYSFDADTFSLRYVKGKIFLVHIARKKFFSNTKNSTGFFFDENNPRHTAEELGRYLKRKLDNYDIFSICAEVIEGA